MYEEKSKEARDLIFRFLEDLGFLLDDLEDLSVEMGDSFKSNDESGKLNRLRDELIEFESSIAYDSQDLYLKMNDIDAS